MRPTQLYLILLATIVSGNIVSQISTVDPNLSQVNFLMTGPCEGVPASTSFDFPTLNTEITVYFEAWSPCISDWGSFPGLLQIASTNSNLNYVFESIDINDGPPLFPFLSLLEEDVEIGPANQYSDATFEVVRLYHSSDFWIEDEFGLYYFGNGGYQGWAENTSPTEAKYAGFQILIDGQTHYGYLAMSVTANMPGFTLNIESMSINETPDTPILTGESSDCPSDMTGDGLTDVNDFLMLNSVYGSSCSGCPEDITGDGLVNVNDFLMMNSVFGETCD